MSGLAFPVAPTGPVMVAISNASAPANAIPLFFIRIGSSSLASLHRSGTELFRKKYNAGQYEAPGFFANSFFVSDFFMVSFFVLFGSIKISGTFPYPPES
jgi:hypothetical protein